MWITYTSGTDAAIAAELINRAYLRDASYGQAGGLLVDIAAGSFVDQSTVPDEALGPFAHALPGRRLGNIVADGLTERWAIPSETAGGGWAIPIPPGWDVSTIAGLPTGYVGSENAPEWPQGEVP